MPDSALPPAMAPLQRMFGRSPHTPLVTLVYQLVDNETSGGFTKFIEGRRYNLRDVREALERIYKGRDKARQRHNALIQRSSAGTRVATGELAVARGGDRFHGQRMGPKLVN